MRLFIAAYLDDDVRDTLIGIQNGLKQHGINFVKDLYANNPKNEPGWYAVRELFEKIVLYSGEKGAAH